ncbi:hypothetical protein ACH5RR_040556 [Cinchona calisaya]|uniref:Reverse transcriptase n=1 Tax=Cinchona calisaya TaxID=153742 RepID=A0ABD2XX83_9GENT
MNGEGVYCEKDTEMEKIMDYYREIFTSLEPTEEKLSLVIDRVQQKVTKKMNGSLLRPYKAKEVTKALLQMQPLKSLRPDYMWPLVFEKYWHVVGRLITNNVLETYEVNHFLKYKDWGRVGLMSIKLDMSKTYDRSCRVEFLEYVDAQNRV